MATKTNENQAPHPDVLGKLLEQIEALSGEVAALKTANREEVEQARREGAAQARELAATQHVVHMPGMGQATDMTAGPDVFLANTEGDVVLAEAGTPAVEGLKERGYFDVSTMDARGLKKVLGSLGVEHAQGTGAATLCEKALAGCRARFYPAPKGAVKAEG